MGFSRRDRRIRGDRERSDDPPGGDRRQPGVDGAQLGQERRRQLVAARELVEHRGRLVADVGDRGGRGPAQVGVLVGQAAEVDLQGAEVGQRGQGRPASNRESADSAAASSAGIASRSSQRRRGGDRAVPDRDVRVGQQRADGPADLGTGRRCARPVVPRDGGRGSSASTIATRASTAAAARRAAGPSSEPSSAGTAAGSLNRPSAGDHPRPGGRPARVFRGSAARPGPSRPCRCRSSRRPRARRRGPAPGVRGSRNAAIRRSSDSCRPACRGPGRSRGGPPRPSRRRTATGSSPATRWSLASASASTAAIRIAAAGSRSSRRGRPPAPDGVPSQAIVLAGGLPLGRLRAPPLAVPRGRLAMRPRPGTGPP